MIVSATGGGTAPQYNTDNENPIDAAIADKAWNETPAYSLAGAPGKGKFLGTGTIILIVLAVAAAAGLGWYYFKKR